MGLACLCLEHAELILYEVQGDSSTYAKTTHALAHRMPADAILLPHSTLNSHRAPLSKEVDTDLEFGEDDVVFRPERDALLANVLQEAFPESELVPVVRKHWNSENGFELISTLAVDDENRHALIKSSESKSVRMLLLTAVQMLASRHQCLTVKCHF